MFVGPVTEFILLVLLGYLWVDFFQGMKEAVQAGDIGNYNQVRAELLFSFMSLLPVLSVGIHYLYS